MQAQDTFYAVALAILLAWLVFGIGTTAPLPDPTPLPDSTPLDSPAPETAHSAPSAPRVMAEVTVDNERFYILVGDGPPSFGVAVSGQ